MRIVGGQWRGRRIEWPDTGATRPITDRIREAVFDILGSRLGTPGALPPLRVADVFSGGGSLGLESLSRGAASACFFDRDREVIRVLRRNLNTLQAGPEALAIVGDVYREGLHAPEEHKPFDLVFLDPPFKDARDTAPRSNVVTLLRRIGTARHTSPDALVVLRHERQVTFPEVVGKRWRQDDRREYGKSAVSFLLRVDAGDADTPSPEPGGSEDQDAHGIV
jgi:16S rRNA (guanine966-N2)-methyltransferase